MAGQNLIFTRLRLLAGRVIGSFNLRTAGQVMGGFDRSMTTLRRANDLARENGRANHPDGGEKGKELMQTDIHFRR